MFEDFVGVCGLEVGFEFGLICKFAFFLIFEDFVVSEDFVDLDWSFDLFVVLEFLLLFFVFLQFVEVD